MEQIIVKIKNSEVSVDNKFKTATLYNFYSDCSENLYELNRILHALSITDKTLEVENKGFTYTFPFQLS